MRDARRQGIQIIVIRVLCPPRRHPFAQAYLPKADSLALTASPRLADQAIAAMQETYAAVVAGNWDAYARKLAKDYVSVGPDGTPKDRERTVADWRQDTVVLSLEVEPVTAREAGEVVFVLAKYKCVDEKRGETRETEGSLFEVWKPTPEGWRCLASHFTG